jgi:hypothetical protein
MIKCGTLIAAFVFFSVTSMTFGADPPASQPAIDVNALPTSTDLPDPFLFQDGSRVKTAADWDRRRTELQGLFLQYEYGRLPSMTPAVTATEDLKTADAALHGKITNLTLHVGDAIAVPMVLTMPEGNGPFPVIVTGDLCWGPVAAPVVSNAIGRGYAICEFDRTKFAADAADKSYGVYKLDPAADCGALAAWAWGYSRVIDYLVTRGDVDAKRIIISGHSRGGKCVLLAGALDTRIALTNPNASGCGGGGCFRVQGEKSEDIKAIVTRFPYWFSPHFGDFIGHIEHLPVEQHELKALVAPRALLTTDSFDDRWANPSGAQATWVAAKVVFDFLGAGERMGLHYRRGDHAHTEEDWTVLLDFADVQLMGRTNDVKLDVMGFPDQAKAFSWSAPTK